ncbi:MAG: hypothetical protein AAF738_06470 [Bacteroidota bacterium]
MMPTILQSPLGCNSSTTPKHIYCLFILCCALAIPSVLDAQNCNCQEYVYLNEPTSGSVHKYLVQPGLPLSAGEVGTPASPWYNGSELPSPHGLGVDVNGNLYISEGFTGGTNIRRLDCDGNIELASDFAITTPSGLFQIGSIGNQIYTNTRERGSSTFITRYDVCDQMLSGTLDFCETDTQNDTDWGFYIDPRTNEMYATSSFGGGDANYFWYFTDEDFGGPCVSAVNLDPVLPQAPQIRGVVTDMDRNVYIAVRDGNNGQILKYGPAPDFTYIGASAVDTAEDGTGYSVISGLIYSETTNLVYASTESDVEDCVATFDTDLNYLGQAVPSPGTGDNAKGIAITRECCPENPNQNISLEVCAPNGTPVFIEDLYGCEGPLCGGNWEQVGSVAGLSYRECDQTFTIAPSAGSCISATFERIGNSSRCGNFSVTLNLDISVSASVEVSGTQELCPNTTGTPMTSTPVGSVMPTGYQWQMTTINCKATDAQWIDIPGATADTYTPSDLTETTFFRLLTFSPGNCNATSCSVASNCLVVAVFDRPNLVLEAPQCNMEETAYSVNFTSDATVTTSAGTVSGNQVIDIPLGTDVTITSSTSRCTLGLNVASPSCNVNCPPRKCLRIGTPTIIGG